VAACFGRGLLVLMAGDFNAKHVDWNSRLNTRRRNLLHDYANENPCLIFGPHNATTIQYNSFATPNDLVMVMVKELPFPVYLTTCSELTSDSLPVLIETASRSSIQNLLDRPDFRRTIWTNFQTHFEYQIPFHPELHNGMAIDTCVENFCSAVVKNLAPSTPKCCQRVDPRAPIPAFTIKYA